MFGTGSDSLDAFYGHMYQFYCFRGLAAILISQFCNIITVGFTVCLSILLIAFIDWNGLMQCESEASCHRLGTYIVSNPFRHNTSRAVVSMIYMILCISYWIWKCGESIRIITFAVHMDWYYREKLGIDAETLQQLKWSQVVDIYIRANTARVSQVDKSPDTNELDIANRIMRRENYMIAFINRVSRVQRVVYLYICTYTL